MTAKTRNLKDYCHTNGARGHYDAGVMFFREHDGDIRRCVIHTEELHALANDNDVLTETVSGQLQLKRSKSGKFEVWCDEPARIGGTDSYPSPITYLAMSIGF